MTEQELKHAQEVISKLAPCVQQILETSILRALRTHSEEVSGTTPAFENNNNQIFKVKNVNDPFLRTKTGSESGFFVTPQGIEAVKQEIPGEREVWAEAYRGGIVAGKSPENCLHGADTAVKYFRERYK